MGLSVAVAGASGYAGGELLRLLAAHPELELGPLAAGSQAGALVTSVHPQLRSLAGRRFVATSAQELTGVDLVLLALPHGESASLVAELPDAVAVVDLGADFRLEDAAAWGSYYGSPHAGTWTYGLPELPGARAAIQASRRVANPGCYATTVPLALTPLLRAGLVEAGDVVVVAASGTSGAGRAAKPHLLGSEVMGDMSAYRVAAHQHTPEIVQTLQAQTDEPVSLSFTTLLAPMPRGILATCTARLARPGTTTEELRGVLSVAYADEPFVHVLDEDQWPHTAATVGSASCHLQVTADPQSGRAVVVAALDNLGKGAATQAIQNANLMLGITETCGLPVDGVAP
jgi:N-acetyl-gamma-glutamyl-phosphate reductase